MSKKEKHPEFENIGNTIVETENFLIKHQNIVLTIVGVIIILFAGYFLLQNYYLIPQEEQAQTQIYQGEQHFAQDSFALALNGDDINYIGFIGIIDEYGMTKSANLAKAYAGISYFKLGEYDEALTYLNKFKSDDKMVSPAIIGLIGDCYIEMGDTEKGISYFLKAAKEKNAFIGPIFLKKAGIAYESLGKYNEAEDVYTRIKEEYYTETQNQDVADIDKYIERAKELKNK